ncbi:MAG: ATP-dependent RecD-like DNA helicase [bacterium]|nr:ATP-dependent RecD-like DNA helicase [bacterium]
MTTYIKGTIVKKIYESRDGFTVGRMKITETNNIEIAGFGKKSISFTGTFIELKERNNYVFYGKVVDHPTYGTQYQVNSYEYIQPSKTSDIIEFLSSSIFPITKTTATKIVNIYKEDTIKKILDDYQILLRIPSIKERKARMIYDILKEYGDNNDKILNISKLGFTIKQAIYLIKKYQNINDIIDRDIYSIIDDNKFFFGDVDSIALDNGIKENDDIRINAIIIHILKVITFSTGSTYLSLEEIIKNLPKFIRNISTETLQYNLQLLVQYKKIVIIDDKYYLYEYYQAEQFITKTLLRYSNNKKYKYTNIEEKITKQEEKNKIIYDKQQKLAIASSLKYNFSIITGGPGTGKTTIIKSIVNMLINDYHVFSNEIALLAPTGRAAKKMAESLYIPAYTIHRFLKWNKESNTFAFNQYNKVAEKIYIIDEASMIDTLLFSSLLKALPKDAKIIMIGDYYQLPSVSQGQILRDLIESNVFNVTHLESIYRQTQNSYIIDLATEIKNKALSESYTSKSSDYLFFESNKNDIKHHLNSIITSALKKGLTDKDIQVLVPIYRGVNGIDNLNIMLQEKFNPPSYEKLELKFKDVTFRVGDKVLQLVNEVEKNVFNGDIGYISDIFFEPKKTIIIDFDGNFVTYETQDLINIRHAYVISVHKAQGSEFNTVILPIEKSYYYMLYNKLVYTAVTRAKKSLIVLGEAETFAISIKNDGFTTRKTTLKEMLINEYNKSNNKPK